VAATLKACAIVAALLPLPALADTTGSPATPAPPSTSISAEDELSPNYQSESGSSNILNLRAQLPNADASWVLRIKIPIVTAAPSESVTGAGDLAIWDLAVRNAGQGQWLIGPTFRFPTASDSLGTNKYSLGPALGYVTVPGRWTMGFFTQAFFSIIGPASSPAVAKTQIAPALKYDLRNGWSLGFSTMQFTYDWVLNRWTNVPLGVRIGKKFRGALKSFDAYLEAEQNLARSSDSPEWTIRALARWKFSAGQNAPSDTDQDQ
jgi:hypothetical protein